MRMTILTVALAATLVSACQPVPNLRPSEPVFHSEVISISTEELEQYWVAPKMRVPGRKAVPDALPTQCSDWTYLSTIDSRGVTVSKKLLSAVPEGCVTQEELLSTPYMVYQPAKSNPERTPVKVEQTQSLRLDSVRVFR